jgi:branched-subunit amino acid transport protein
VTEVWIAIAGLTLATMALKAAGPLILGGRELPERALAVIALLAPALLAALVLTGTFTDEKELTLDPRAAGLASAALAALLRAPLLVTVLVAAVATAAVRAVT